MRRHTHMERGMLHCIPGTTGADFMNATMSNDTEMRASVRLARATRHLRYGAGTVSSPTRAISHQHLKPSFTNPSLNDCHDIRNEDECNIRSNNNAHELCIRDARSDDPQVGLCEENRRGSWSQCFESKRTPSIGCLQFTHNSDRVARAF
jgi:hypothetical protein